MSTWSSLIIKQKTYEITKLLPETEYTISINGTYNEPIEVWLTTLTTDENGIVETEVNQDNAVYVGDLEYNRLTFTAQELHTALVIRPLGDLDLTSIQLEKGNVATDWTPAPEDIEEYTEKTASEKAEAIWNMMDEILYGEDGGSGLNKVVQENSSNIQVTTEYIQNVVDVNIEGLDGEFSGLNETVQTATQTISTIEGKLTSIEGDVTSTNQTVTTMTGDITTLTTTVTGVTGDVDEINTYFKRDVNTGLTIGGTGWDTKLILDPEELRFVSGSSDVKASFGSEGMYVNKWQTDLHTIEKFEDGTYKATIFRDRRE